MGADAISRVTPGVLVFVEDAAVEAAADCLVEALAGFGGS